MTIPSKIGSEHDNKHGGNADSCFANNMFQFQTHARKVCSSRMIELEKSLCNNRVQQLTTSSIDGSNNAESMKKWENEHFRITVEHL